MELQSILEIIKESSLDSGVKLILSLLTLLFFNKLRSKEFRVRISKSFKNFFKYLGGNGLGTHYIFYDYKYYIRDAKKIKFDCKDKTIAFRILIGIKFSIAIDEIRKWIKVNKKCYKSWDKLRFSQEFENLLKRSRKKFEKVLLDKYIIEFGNEQGREYFNVIMEGEKGFRKFHYKNSSIMDSFLNNIFIHEHLSNTVLIYKFLGILDTILSVTVDDLHVTFSKLNGRLCKEKKK